MKMKIKILITGGTIDNLDYGPGKDAPKNQKTIIPKLLKQSRITANHSIDKVIFKDSRLIKDGDRKLILKKCRESKENKIIITHGTATMALTAKYLGRNNINKTIVLFGSAIPASKEKSDALFNLGFALAAAQTLPKGVYVAMNGKIFMWNNVKKNLKTGMFEKEK